MVDDQGTPASSAVGQEPVDLSQEVPPSGVALRQQVVADAGVAPVPASGQEQTATAFIVVAPGAQTTEKELLAWCRERLAAHQVPAFVTFADRLPRNSVGKLIR